MHTAFSPPTSDQHQRVSHITHAWTHSRKGKKGNKVNAGGKKLIKKRWRHKWHYCLATSLLSAGHFFFFLGWWLALPLSQCLKPHQIWRYSHLLVDYFNRIPTLWDFTEAYQVAGWLGIRLAWWGVESQGHNTFLKRHTKAPKRCWEWQISLHPAAPQS